MSIETTPDAILKFAADRAQEAWEKNEYPYLLARLSPDLAREGVNYKGVLGDQKLADFVRSAPGQVKVVSHPTQKSKIGLIPPERDFEFPMQPGLPEPRTSASSPPSDRNKSSRRRYIVSNFLQLLSELDDADAAQVQIPTNILTKLMRD